MRLATLVAERLPHNTPLTIVNLDLSFNQLTTLNGFDVLVNLKHLNVSHNAINSTWGLYSNNVTPGSNNNKKNKGYNDTLLTLDISHNYIGVIEGLERHKKLEVVNISNNNLRSYNDVRSLSLNTNLKVRQGVTRSERRQRGAKRRAGNVVIPRVTMRSEAKSKVENAFSMDEDS